MAVEAEDHEEVKRIVESEGRIRKSELEERVDTSQPLRDHLMLLVNLGEAAIFPVGDVVIIRSE